MRHLCLAAVVFFSVSAAQAAEEAEIRKLLPGTWLAVREKGGVKMEGETTYKADGTMTGKAHVSLPNGKSVDIEMEGTWTVKGSKVESTVTKSNHPSMKIGPASPDDIVEITEKVKKHKDTSGEIITETRK